jgi:hypothetical protein
MEKCGDIKTLFFFDKGSSKIQATFDKDSYNVGETAHVECFVDNTGCEKSIKCLKIKFRRFISGMIRDDFTLKKDETIIKRKFDGIKKGHSGIIKLDCPILLVNNTERFINTLPHEYRSRYTPDLDDLKTVTCPTA